MHELKHQGRNGRILSKIFFFFFPSKIEFANEQHDLMNWVIFHGFIRQKALIFVGQYHTKTVIVSNDKSVQWNLDLRKPDLRKNLDLRKIVATTNF